MTKHFISRKFYPVFCHRSPPVTLYYLFRIFPSIFILPASSIISSPLFLLFLLVSFSYHLPVSSYLCFPVSSSLWCVSVGAAEGGRLYHNGAPCCVRRSGVWEGSRTSYGSGGGCYSTRTAGLGLTGGTLGLPGTQDTL